jgi:hypothetical protein
MIRNDLDDAEKQQAVSEMRLAFKTEVNPRQSRLSSRQSVLTEIGGIQEGEEVDQEQINMLYKGKGEAGHKVTASAEVVIEGYLNKKSGQLLVGFQQRFFTVRNGHLYWYKSQTSREACSSCDLSLLEDVSAKGNSGKFDIRVEGRILKLDANTSAIRQQWIQALQASHVPEGRSTDALFQIKGSESLLDDLSNALTFKPDRLQVSKQASAAWPKKPRRSIAKSICMPGAPPTPRAMRDPGSSSCFCIGRRRK